MRDEWIKREVGRHEGRQRKMKGIEGDGGRQKETKRDEGTEDERR